MQGPEQDVQEVQDGGFLPCRSAHQLHLGQLDVGGAEVVVDQVVEPLCRIMEAEGLDGLGGRGEFRPQPFTHPEFGFAEFWIGGQRDVLSEVHLDESCRIPELVAEVPGGLEPRGAHGDVGAGRGHDGQGEAQGVGAELLHDLEGIDDVALGLGHLLAAGVPHQAVEVDLAEGHFAHPGEARHGHARHPEEQDVVARNEHAGGVVALELRGLLGPAEHAEGPQRRAEPGVQRVWILLQFPCSACAACGGRLHLHMKPAALGAGPGRDAVAPHQLAADAPVLDVGEPVLPDGGVVGGRELDAAVADGLQGHARGVLHVHEPLLADQRLQHGATAVAEADLVGVVLHLHQEALFLEIGHHALPGLEAVQARVDAGGGGHLRIEADDGDGVQLQALACGEVVGIVGGRHLHAAGAEGGVHEAVGHHGDLAAREGVVHELADHALVPLVVGVHGHGRVAQHGLGPRGGDHHLAAAVRQGIAQVPELAPALLVLHFQIAQRRLEGGIPLDHAGSAVDAAGLVALHEDLAHGLVESRIQREAVARPVHGAAQALELVLDGALVLLLPRPDAGLEGVPAQLVAVRALGLELALHHHLRGDAGVVGAGHPEGVVALGPLEAREHIMQRVHQGVAHVQVARDVGRRDDDGPGLLAALGGRLEGAGVLPHRVPARLRRPEVESLVHLAHCHPCLGLSRLPTGPADWE